MENEPRFSEGRSCSTCRYWMTNVKTKTEAEGQCRYNSPGVEGWPESYLNDWCRCWKSEFERAGRPKKFTVDNVGPLVLGALGEYGGDMCRTEIHQFVFARLELSFWTFAKLLDQLVDNGTVRRSGRMYALPGVTEEEAPA